MPWLKSVKFLTSQFIRSVCINNAKSSMGTSLKSTWVRVKILTCRNFVTHIVIFTAYPGPLILSIDIDFNFEMESNDVLICNQQLIHIWSLNFSFLLTVRSQLQTNSNIILVSQLFSFHVLGGLSLSRVVLRKEKSPIQVELPQNS